MTRSDVSGPDERGTRGPRTPHPATTLRFVRVTYADAPDRCTIHPPARDRIAKMSTWLTADEDAFVDLEGWR